MQNKKHSYIFYLLGAFEMKPVTGEMSNLSFLCRYRCLIPRTVFANTNTTVAGDNCMFNKAAVSTVEKTALKRLFFYLW